jgi:hypothetical protein
MERGRAGLAQEKEEATEEETAKRWWRRRRRRHRRGEKMGEMGWRKRRILMAQ